MVTDTQSWNNEITAVAVSDGLKHPAYNAFVVREPNSPNQGSFVGETTTWTGCVRLAHALWLWAKPNLLRAT